MPHIDTLKESKYLTKEECGPRGRLVTIAGGERVNAARQGQEAEWKWAVKFAEPGVKPWVTGATTRAILAAILESPITENWNGRQIVLFNDPTVFFNGKQGGIRPRLPYYNPLTAPGAGAPPVAQGVQTVAQPDAAPPVDEDVPY